MPTFCRHNRLVQNCPICAREQDVELRPVVSPRGPLRSATAPASRTPRLPGVEGSSRSRGVSGRGSPGVTVRRLARGSDDGYRIDLAPGLKSSVDAERLAEEMAWATARVARLATDPPGLYAEVADATGDLEERTWLALEIAYLGPLDGQAPFSALEQVRVPWSAGTGPELDGVAVGPRGSHEPSRGQRTLDAYRAWAARAGSQAAALTGDAGWAPDRRFARAFERLALPGLERAARFDLLLTLGATGAYALRAGALAFGTADPVTLAAKRLLGIGDPLLLERRAAELAEACGVPLEALDAAFFNWERGERSTLGMDPGLEPDPVALSGARAALGL
ncbi:MAG: hypothetical protein ACR2GZ_11490 [Solirubrobacteraceae bacterium]